MAFNKYLWQTSPVVSGFGVNGLSGDAGKYVRVNSSELNLEFVAPTGTGSPVNSINPTVSNLTTTGYNGSIQSGVLTVMDFRQTPMIGSLGAKRNTLFQTLPSQGSGTIYELVARYYPGAPWTRGSVVEFKLSKNYYNTVGGIVSGFIRSDGNIRVLEGIQGSASTLYIKGPVTYNGNNNVYEIWVSTSEYNISTIEFSSIGLSTAIPSSSSSDQGALEIPSSRETTFEQPDSLRSAIYTAAVYRNVSGDNGIRVGASGAPSYTVDVQGTLGVTSAATFQSTLAVTGASTFNVIEASGSIRALGSNGISFAAADTERIFSSGGSIFHSYNGNTVFKWNDAIVDFQVPVSFATSATVEGALAVTSNFQINTDKFTVDASSGNTLIAGTLNVTGYHVGTTGFFNNFRSPAFYIGTSDQGDAPLLASVGNTVQLSGSLAISGDFEIGGSVSYDNLDVTNLSTATLEINEYFSFFDGGGSLFFKTGEYTHTRFYPCTDEDYSGTIETGNVHILGDLTVEGAFNFTTSASSLYVDDDVSADYYEARDTTNGFRFFAGTGMTYDSEGGLLLKCNNNIGLRVESSGSAYAYSSFTTPILTVTGNISATATTLGFFGKAPVTRSSISGISTAIPDPVSDTAANMSYLGELANKFNTVVGALKSLGLAS